MRYFYTERLAAQWMEKHFGIKTFKQWEGLFPLPEIDDATGQRYYYRDDSLQLLEPQAGDLISAKIYKNDDRIYCDTVVSVIKFNDAGYPLPVDEGMLIITENGSALTEAMNIKIVQRHGVAFMWPEYEA